jgi:hypothetical protein
MLAGQGGNAAFGHARRGKIHHKPAVDRLPKILTV